ncbi:N-terminal glutamine amidase-domain-containing protein [Pilobolus umbonatus]|nr:N-terminal glutamine amidase-domain-containing protein [Pilobolus umbonatus]
MNLINIQRDSLIYTSHYCEENIYMLCKTINEKYPELIDDCTVIFISNEERKIPMWMQKAAGPVDPVVWDYHVILLYENEACPLILDVDTLLPFPCPADIYTVETLKPQLVLQKQYERYFRLIPATMYLREFASDRSHMLNEMGEYSAPPPIYPPIKTKGRLIVSASWLYFLTSSCR